MPMQTINKFQNIYLIGPMGAGKSSVGRQLAKLSKKQFFDTDAEIEKRTGVTISWIFEVETETGFRKREETIIAELTKMDNIVLSTGGGCIITKNNRLNLATSGIVVYLKVSFDIQVKRTSRHTGTRPLLEVADPADILTELNAERAPLYEEIADLIYETDNKTPRAIASKILKDIEKMEQETKTKAPHETQTNDKH